MEQAAGSRGISAVCFGLELGRVRQSDSAMPRKACRCQARKASRKPASLQPDPIQKLELTP